MNENEVLDKVLLILKDDLGIGGEIDLKTSIIQNKTLDSMDWMSFLTILEDEFAIEIPNAEADKFQIGYIDNLVKFIMKKINN